MHIRVVPSGKYHLVYLVENWREGGTTRSRNVVKFGRLEDLVKDDPDALDKLKAKYNEDREKAAGANEQLIAKLNDEALSSSTNGAAPSVGYGLEPLRQIWEKDLDLSYWLNYLKRYKTKLDFDVDAVSSYMVGQKVLDPSSILTAYDARTSLFGNLLKGCQLQHLYRALDFLHSNKEQIIKHVNKKLDSIVNRSYSMAFYDVTNVYFESPLTDEERNKINDEYLDEVIEIIKDYQSTHGLDNSFFNNDGSKKSADEIALGLNFFDEDGNILFENLPQDLYHEIKGLLFFKMRGLSKEHRYDLPLIPIALVIDEYGFPIDYEVFSGCRSEFKTMPEAIEQIKTKYNIKDTVIVADRGLNSVTNLDMLLQQNYGFIVAQKITNLNDEFRSKMLDDNGYLTIEGVPYEEYHYKVVDNYVKVDKKTKTKVTCKIVFAYSKDRAARDLKQLEQDIAKAKDAVVNNKCIYQNTRNWQSMVKVDNKEACKALALNQELIDKRKAECGYSAVVYHKAPNVDKDLTPLDLAASYHRLVKIEECFRIMKSNLGLRPMFVSNTKHIYGHCLVCYLALVMIRLLEFKLKQSGHTMTIERIISALNSGKLTVVKINGEVLFINTNEYKGLYKQGFDKDQEKSVDELKLQLKEKKLDLDVIMETCGLTPLSKVNKTNNINKCFKRKYRGHSDMLDQLIVDLI